MVLGILAHVDAGKTTLSEAILYTSGNLRKLGRVDNRDAFLDTYELERKRGITIFSKQAMLTYEGYPITLLDTPGHVDFSAEMERTLQVLDAAILVISASDGVQGHTRTLWRLLKRYEIPTFLFINKMDQPDVDKAQLMMELTKELDGGCIDFGKDNESLREEALAMCDEELLNQFLESGSVQTESVKKAVRERRVFPCFFGSALKLWGVGELLQGLKEYAELSEWSDEFGARVFKITRDVQGNRLTHLKVTGGKLQAKDVIASEKINQIRLYSGDKFESVTEVRAGDICAVTGLQETYPGQGFGVEKELAMPSLEPVLSYCVELPEETDAAVMLPKLRQLEEEDPMLQIDYSEEHGEIYAKVMGEVQLEVLQSMIEERFGVTVSFGTGKIVYKETIAKPVEGVGHFEPLRHYAEVHLFLEPGEAGSGLTFAADCSEDVLSRNWQRLVLTHLEERAHRGVLTGSVITDMKITLVTGKAHLKHTEGGDFRQATYRAVRQGLMEAESVLLEPMYEFRLEIPQEAIGRAMTDVEKMHGRCILEQREGKLALLTGTAPVVTMREYQKEVTAYTKGTGKLSCELKGYMPCHNAHVR
ncbi:MAG: TetM/TetW/TetO/TetS family tetracycline resistance ribosomal protection protein [Lachnospiraceae bacterium]|nr:TetM/TetW/TetO/TetS family tetracycline resistance ribosomal protection protein [Lachnospiraceae bacterium]